MKKLNLSNYYGEIVKITFFDDTELIGFVSSIDDASSNENGKESLSLTETPIATYVDVNEEEIKEIEIIN